MERLVVFLVRQRFQLRFSRDPRREGRSARTQLPRQGRSRTKEGRALLYEGRTARTKRLLPSRRRLVPHLLDLCPWHGKSHQYVYSSRHDTLRAAAGLRRLALRLASEANLRVDLDKTE